ncbi:TonB-dependent siderophore receptor [Prevotella sp. 10(H)]|uniref:TonB-dependent receptor plug domain-containing protein n=1 Tax=Prevotella sp. 10(H) TaxID=1158294 RepID=UPI000561D2CE|nr:TonB-dependent receptor [Prevotella sp. 10(H)]
MRTSLSVILFLILSGYQLLQAQTTDTIKTQNLSEVEVSANVKPSSSRSTTPLQVIDNTEMERIGILSVSDAVRRFSGVTVKDYGGIGGIKTVSIRGMGAQHTAVSYDGVTISDIQSGQIDIGRFSLDNISDISLSIGQSDDIFQSARSYASAGLLQVNTSQPVFSNKSYKLNIQAKTGSFGLFNPMVYYAQRLNKKFSIATNVGWERNDGMYKFTYKNADKTEERKRRNSDVNIWRTEFNLYGNLGKGGELKFKANYYDSERGLPGSIIFYKDDNDERVWNKDFFSQLHYKNTFSQKLELKAQAKFSRTYYKYISVNNNIGNNLQEDRITQFEYYASAGIVYKPVQNFSVSLFEDVFQNRLHSNFADVDKPTRLSSLTALAAQFSNRHLTITGSLLATYVDEKVRSGEEPDDKKKITPAISVSYLPFLKTNLRIRASYKKIFRVPTFNDLYYVRMGNINLKPEYATQYNAGLTWTGRISDMFDLISISADGYKNKVDDKIVPFPTMNIFKMRNYGKVDMTGLDVNTRAHIAIINKLSVDIAGNYSYQKVIDVTDENNKNYKHQIPYTPRHYGSGSISIENPWVNIAYTIIISGKRYALDQNIPDNEIESYTDHSISLNKSFSIRDHNLRLQLNLTNLSNKNYQIIKYYPMPGRSFTFSANYQF